MTYRILNNKMGVIVTRSATVHQSPKTGGDSFSITFESAPDGALAVFDNNGFTIYRNLKNGRCRIPLNMLSGKVDVTLAQFGDAPANRWLCEGFIVQHLSGGKSLVFPDDFDLKQAVVDLRFENERIRKEQEVLKEDILKLTEKLNQALEGYNVT